MENEIGWKNYLAIRDFLVEKDLLLEETSDYWSEESSSIEYMLNATPEIISRIRDHTHWLTGVRSYDYKRHHQHREELFVSKYRRLRDLSKDLDFFGETGILGDFGFEIDGQLVNLDTLKYFESIIALSLAGELDRLRNYERPVILEIGAGWGGLLAMVKKHIPNSQLVVVDLPLSLLFSATYLPSAFPHVSVGFFGSSKFTGNEDLLFLTPTQFRDWKPKYINLAINTVSFQEMTSNQIKEYGRQLLSKSCSVLYSHNMSVSPNNKKPESVEECLSTWQYQFEIEVLPMDYTRLKYQNDSEFKLDLKTRNVVIYFIFKLVQKIFNRLGLRIQKKLLKYCTYFARPELCVFLFPKISHRSNSVHSSRYKHIFFYSNLEFSFLK
jgi:putative sugar O-methyltransferase